MPILCWLLFLLTLCGVFPARALDASALDIAKQHRHNSAVIQDEKGSGSGFIARIGGGVYLLTNQHVVAGMESPNFLLADGTRLKPGEMAAAVGHDIMAYRLRQRESPLEVMAGVDRAVAVGDDVVVLGNPDGEGVVRPITGKVLGLGADLVEVSAEFVAGNSGSPIVHVPSGKVIAVATYIRIEKKDETLGRASESIRRFGYRLDSIRQWQVVRWWEFQEEHRQIERVKAQTTRLMAELRVLFEMETKSPGSWRALFAPQGAAMDTLKKMRAADGDAAAESALLAQVKEAVNKARQRFDEDLPPLRPRIGYDYFSRALEEETAKRKRLLEMFDSMIR